MKHSNEPEDPRLTAYALGELEGTEEAEVKALLQRDDEAAKFVAEVREMANLLTNEFENEKPAQAGAVKSDSASSNEQGLGADRRADLLEKIDERAGQDDVLRPVAPTGGASSGPAPSKRPWYLRTGVKVAAAASVTFVAAAAIMPARWFGMTAEGEAGLAPFAYDLGISQSNYETAQADDQSLLQALTNRYGGTSSSAPETQVASNKNDSNRVGSISDLGYTENPVFMSRKEESSLSDLGYLDDEAQPSSTPKPEAKADAPKDLSRQGGLGGQYPAAESSSAPVVGGANANNPVSPGGSTRPGGPGGPGRISGAAPSPMTTGPMTGGPAGPPSQSRRSVSLEALGYTGTPDSKTGMSPGAVNTGTDNFFLGLGEQDRALDPRLKEQLKKLGYLDSDEESTTEAYDYIEENKFIRVADDARSTFSIDVDTASYANVRRFLSDGKLPPADAVRIEEMVNYFPYSYAEPTDGRPFSVDVEVASAPWAPAHRLMRVALKGQSIDFGERKPSNLVFLMDVSGSMNSAQKLPLLKKGLQMLASELDGRDRVAIVVYAGAAGLVLPSTSGSNSAQIVSVLENLRAGGSTNGGQGIRLAYDTARANFIEGGVNRVILATDGDFNVGTSSDGDLIRLIQDEAKSGVFLTVLGFGSGNLKDSRMEQIANKGNGAYAYIDSLREARKVLVEEMGGTLETIAKDVKLQIEFNPAEVGSFRLIGYENRKLQHQDFKNDKVDAGEIGAGHCVTALYELVPVGVESAEAQVDPLKYQRPVDLDPAAMTGELATIALRYKAPDADTSVQFETVAVDSNLEAAQAGDDFRFAASVASFGMLLRRSKYSGSFTFDDVLELAKSSLGADMGQYRAEFLAMVQVAKGLRR